MDGSGLDARRRVRRDLCHTQHLECISGRPRSVPRRWPINGFAESLADDGRLSGRGTALLRGLVCGLMTMAGGIGHTLPYLITDFWTAMAAACAVVLAMFAWTQWRYMDTSMLLKIYIASFDVRRTNRPKTATWGKMPGLS